MSTLGIPFWMVFVIITILLIFSWGFFLFKKRKGILNEVKEIEQWMGRISGITEVPGLDPEWKKKPNKVKDRYLSILTSLDEFKADAITDLQLIIMDVDEALKGYHFKKCHKNLEEARRKLKVLEEEMRNHYEHISLLRDVINEVESLNGESGQVRQKAERRLDELRFQYGYAFHSLKERLNRFDREFMNIKEKEEQGNFEEVRDRLQQLLQDNQTFIEILRRLPVVRQMLEKELNQEIRQLDEDVQELVDGVFGGESESIHAELVKIKGKNTKLPRLFEDGKIEEAEQLIIEVREDIEKLYEKMESIVTGYQQYFTHLQELPHYLGLLKDDRTYLTEELNDLSARYQVSGGDVFLYNRQIEAIITEIESALQKTAASQEKVSYLRYKEAIASLTERAGTIINQRDEIIQELKEFRKGETQALEEMQQLKSDIARVEQQLKRLHLPGIPEGVKHSIALSHHTVLEVEKSLAEIPLNIEKVNHYLKEASSQVIDLLERATEMIQLSQETEEKIQQTNRYRRQDSEIEGLLREAEKAFRSLDFEESFRLADMALEISKSKYQKENRL